MSDTIPQINPEPQPTKFCKGCQQRKDATKDFFYSDRSKRDGWSTLCKVCLTPEGKQRRMLEQAQNTPPEGYRRCTSCEKTLPATPDHFFHRNKKQDEFHTECKDCQNKRRNDYLEEHPGYWKEWYHRNAEEQIARVAIYRETHTEELAQRRKDKYAANKNEARAASRAFYHANAEKIRERAIAARRKKRLLVLNHYCGGTPFCTCCGDTHLEFLTIDHIAENGAEHRREIKTDIYTWLSNNKFPEGFQVLCFNCNCAKHIHQVCPHQRK